MKLTRRGFLGALLALGGAAVLPTPKATEPVPPIAANPHVDWPEDFGLSCEECFGVSAKELLRTGYIGAPYVPLHMESTIKI